MSANGNQKNNYDAVVMGASWTGIFRPISNAKGGVLQENKYIDFPYIFAMVKTKLAGAKGYTFTTKDPQLQDFWHKLEKESRIMEKVSLMLFNIFYYGVAYAGFDKIGDKDYRMFAISNKNFKTYIGKIYEDIVGIWYLKEVKYATGMELMIRERWDLKNVERTYWYNKAVVPVAGIPSEIPKQYILPEQEPNPFSKYKIIPFQDFPNYTFSDKPDWWPVRNYIDVFNKKIDYLLRELKLNRSRVALRMTPKQKLEFEKRMSEGKSPLDDYIVEVKTTGDENKLAEIIPSSIQIQAICAEISNQIKELFSLSGLSYNNTIENPQTATEVSASQSGLTNTITQSQRAFNENMNIFLEKLFTTAGFEGKEFSFTLNENTAIDQSTILNETIIALNNGLMTRERAIGTIFNMNDDEARLELEKIEKDQQREQELANESENANDEGNDIDKGKKSPEKGQN